MNETAKKISMLVKKAVRLSALNQSEIAKKLEITPPSLSQMLNGKANLPYKHFKTIAKLIEIEDFNEIEKLYREKALENFDQPEVAIDRYLINQEHYGADVYQDIQNLDSLELDLKNLDPNAPDTLSIRNALEQEIVLKKRKIVEKTKEAKERRTEQREFATSTESPMKPPYTPPPIRNTIRNTPELRECIKDAMLEQGIRNAAELCRQIGYDAPNTLERLLSGKINWFPDMLSAVLDNLKICHDKAPMTPTERGLLQPEGIYYNDGTQKTRAVLVHYQPVISWANAASYIDCLMSNDGVMMKKWNPEDVEETVPVPLDIRGVCSIFRISGQSMEPAINDGDIIYCEQVMDLHSIPDKRVVVVRFSDCNKFEDCIVCKRFRRFGDKILLTSDNPSGREFELEPQDITWIGILRKLTKNGDTI